jgi:hypothetical protein
MVENANEGRSITEAGRETASGCKENMRENKKSNSAQM